MTNRMNDEFKTLQKFDAGNGREGFFIRCRHWKSKASEKFRDCRSAFASCSNRSCEIATAKRSGAKMSKRWRIGTRKKPANEEIPFVVARIVLQDFTGVPLVVDLAAMRSAVQRLGGDPKIIEPLVPVDLVVDHSVQVDFFGSADALAN